MRLLGRRLWCIVHGVDPCTATLLRGSAKTRTASIAPARQCTYITIHSFALQLNQHCLFKLISFSIISAFKVTTMLANSIIPSRADSGCGGCASCEPTTPKDPFTLLVHEIREYLGLSSGIDSSDVDTEHLRALMAKYTSNPAEWERYARADLSRNYTRNLVDSVNGKANLVCYTPHALDKTACSSVCRSSSSGIRPRARLFMTTRMLIAS